MELRVIVIAAISVVIVAMSLALQGHLRQSPATPRTAVDLMDRSARNGRATCLSPMTLERAHSTRRDSSDLGEDLMSDPAEPTGADADWDSGWDEEDTREPLEPPALRRGNLQVPADSSSHEPNLGEPTESSAAAAEPPATPAVEKLIEPEPGLEPLETVWAATPGSADETLLNDVPAPPPMESIPVSDEPAPPPQNAAESAVVAETEAPPAVADETASTANETEPSAPSVAVQREVPSSVIQIARNHLQYGNTLARRGSIFSARQEFFSGLRLIIESLDLVNQVDCHRQDYDRAIIALREAEDFSPAADSETSRSVEKIVSLHQSKVLSEEQARAFTPLAALQAYFAYAQKHLSAACGKTPVASELLFALGKLHSLKAAQSSPGEPIDLAIAILMHQSALSVDPSNYLSANELGVALARLGHFESARAALLQSVAIHPTSEAWLNLSIVHRQLGETQLADLARAEEKALVARQSPESLASHPIRWMPPGEFAQSQQVGYEAPPSAGSASAAPPNTVQQAAGKPGDASIWTRLRSGWGSK